MDIVFREGVAHITVTAVLVIICMAEQLMRFPKEVRTCFEEVAKNSDVHVDEIPQELAAAISDGFAHRGDPEDREKRIAFRRTLFQRLRSPPSDRLLRDGQEAGLSPESIQRLVQKGCPLGSGAVCRVF